MTLTSPGPAAAVPPGTPGPHTPPDAVHCVIDGFEVAVPKGTLIIRAAEMIGIQIPRFCDHPLLEPVGACRQCLVEVEGQRKPVASCTMPVTDGMVVQTQLTSPVADKAQQGTMELLLINHPLDCPVCDKGGECPLQNQAMSNGRTESRFIDVKRTYPKPLPISTEILLDRERCVLCARCTRFSQQVAGDPFIELFERGALEQVAIYEDEPFESYFSGNTTQICPVGALTSAQYRFRARPFDLRSEPSVCEHCASGCAQRTDYRRGKVTRRLAGEDPAVNEEWNCDKGRFAFRYATSNARLTTPLVRGTDGELHPASWPEAWAAAAAGLLAAREDGGVGVLPGGRLTVEDAYAYAKFARVALGTNDVDARARAHSAEELAFLEARIAGTGPGRGAVTYQHIDEAPAVLLAGLEPEEESPIVFLRLRRNVRTRALPVFDLAPFATAPRRSCRPTVLTTLPAPRRSRCARSPTARGAAPRSRRSRSPAPSCSPASVSPRPPGPSRPSSRWPGRPAPAWRGCRAGRGSAGPSRPARCPACCPAAGASATPPRGPTSPSAGASTSPTCRPHPAATPTASSPRCATARSPVCWSAASTPPTCPTRRWPRRARGGVVRRQPGDVPLGRDRAGRRRPARRRGR